MVVTTTTQPTHVFQDGETLWSIAESLLGDAQRWREIVDLNGIDDPSAIPSGLVLVLPQQATESASTTATSTTTAWTSTTLSESDQMLESRYEWGSGGDRVAALQDLLGVQADGWYGANTREAHIAALTSRGLSTVLVPSPPRSTGGATQDGQVTFDEDTEVTFEKDVLGRWLGSDGSVCEFDDGHGECIGGDKSGVWFDEAGWGLGLWLGIDGTVCESGAVSMTCR